MADREPPPIPFRKERAVAGLALVGLAIVLALIDAISTDYELDPVKFALILGTGAVFMGVDALAKLIR